MSGIRNVAMGTKEEPKAELPLYHPTNYAPSYNPKYDETYWEKEDKERYKDPYNPSESELKRDKEEFENKIEPCEKDQDKKITIEFYIDQTEVEIEMEKYNIDYDWEPVGNRVITIAYDKLKKLLNNNWESKYITTFESEESFEFTGKIRVITTLKETK